MDDIGKLRRNRGVIKGQLTRAHNWIKAFDPQNQQIEGVEVRIATIERAWIEFNKSQDEIENVDPDALDDGEREVFESDYYAAVTLAKSVIAAARREDQNRNQGLVVDMQNAITPINAENQIKLPPIHLPTFNGSYDPWPSFRDTFKAIIDENQRLSDIKKFYYLRSALKGVAAEIIASIAMTADNYEIAWNLLEGRFENKRVLIHHHLQALFEFPGITKESHALLRQLLDTTEKHVRALKKLGQPTDQWGAVLIYLLTAKLDSTTKREWENKTSSRDIATYEQFIEFLRNRCIMLETLHLDKSRSFNPSTPSSDSKAGASSKKSIAAVSTDSRVEKCAICKKGDYRIYHCPTFLNLEPQARSKEVKALKICPNCLKGGHKFEACSFGTCRLCSKKHNTLLHYSKTSDNATSDQTDQSENSSKTASSADKEQTTTLTHCAVRSREQGLLATAIIQVQDVNGQFHEGRAFLDPGSQTNFMTLEMCNKLQLPQQKNQLSIRGIHGIRATALTETRATIQSRFHTFKTRLTFSLLPEITAPLPLSEINKRNLKLPPTITLADPSFHRPGRIDILLGGAIFWDLLCVGQVKLGRNQPVAQKTKLGWIIAGPMGLENQEKIPVVATHAVQLDDDLKSQLERFWHVEEVAPRAEPSRQEYAKKNYSRSYRRNAEGRFEIRLPLREDITQLGYSREVAIKRLKSIERKLARSQDLKKQYQDFLIEYMELNHMTPVENAETEGINYLPHHAVMKEDSTTTKLRVVFDASSPTSTGKALNDILRVGPNIQQDLLHILIRFRQHRYVLTADIQKMYRQILLQEDQRNLQRIVWRREQNDPIQDFRLNTLTYGLASATFLATRCLNQLAIDNQESQPEASKVIRNDFYVDDLLTGNDDLNALRRLKVELSNILNSAGFPLHKWNTNEPSLLENTTDSTALLIAEEIKTLGISWNTAEDCLQYKTRIAESKGRATKRSVLSTIAQVYDPLGLMGPTIVCAKMMLQQLWKLKLGWDESLPMDLHTKWTRYQQGIENISSISVPRQVTCSEPQHIEIHGFCDASEAAYGACIYLRSMNGYGEIRVRLLCAKSKVAPLKQITLPRLELCGALLLVKLGQTVQQAFSIKINAVHYWSDSTITLAWIRHNTGELHTFVANRVADIQRIAPQAQWHHVRSKENPADIISRGTTSENLKTLQLWWEGPPWLSEDSELWPVAQMVAPETIPELRKQTVACHGATSHSEWFDKFSSLTRLKRVTAYCLRFKFNALNKQCRKAGPLSVKELENATLTLLRMAQEDEFMPERVDLQATLPVRKGSKLIALNPFVDKEGLIRVGGRIHRANLEYEQRHPVVLPAKHALTERIIRDAHLKQLHIGPQGLLAHLRQRYWILSGRQAVRRILRKCIVCFRARPTNVQQIMGNLPENRVKPSRAFLHSGVDYAGPFSIKISRNKSGKAYLCLFICFSTKATHLEVVSDLSTTAFLNALKRFIARRGRCAKLYSDNGLNFVGANNELKALTNMLHTNNNDIENFLAEQSIQWEFIPPYSPHMGGLWEAGVKSAKTHLTKIIGNVLLSFEELTTIFTQIEAVLNSRPLCAMSEDPQDYEVLTPGHFIIGEPLNSFPEPDLSDIPVNRLTRFQLLSQMRRHFWARWSMEYITQLQNRYKWQRPNEEAIKPNALVLIRDNNLPPLKWNRGRIIETFPGNDNRVRVVNIKTANRTTKRAINKICILPIDM